MFRLICQFLVIASVSFKCAVFLPVWCTFTLWSWACASGFKLGKHTEALLFFYLQGKHLNVYQKSLLTNTSISGSKGRTLTQTETARAENIFKIQRKIYWMLIYPVTYYTRPDVAHCQHIGGHRVQQYQQPHTCTHTQRTYLCDGWSFWHQTDPEQSANVILGNLGPVLRN